MTTLVNPIPNMYTKQGDLFSYTLPQGGGNTIFSGTGTLTYKAYIERPNVGIEFGSQAGPQWLTFNPTTRTFSGTPLNWKDCRSLVVVVECTDSAATTAYSIFTLTVGFLENTGRPVYRSGTAFDFTYNLANHSTFDPAGVTAGKWVRVSADLWPLSSTANTKIAAIRANGGYVVWELANTNLSIFDYIVADPGETIAINFDSGSIISAIRTNGRCQGVKGNPVFFTNLNQSGIIRDNTTQPIAHNRNGADQDAWITWIGQPPGHTPFSNVFPIKVMSSGFRCIVVNGGFQNGFETSNIEVGDSHGILWHIKSDVINNTGTGVITGDRRSSVNSGGLNYNMQYIQIHHCYGHDSTKGGTGGEIIYLGGGFYPGKTVNGLRMYYHDIEYAIVDHCILLRAGWDAIQMKNCVREGWMIFNYVKDTGQGGPNGLPANAQAFGIFFTDGALMVCAFNFVHNPRYTGIRGYDSGQTLVHDNIIYHTLTTGGGAYYGAKAGLVNRDMPALDSPPQSPGYVSRPDLLDADLYCYIYHNTFIDFSDTLRIFTDNPQGRIWNNLFINCVRTDLDRPSVAGWSESGNYFALAVTLTDVFVNPAQFDFRPKTGAPFINAGVPISGWTEKDYGNKTRHATTPTPGAFEDSSFATLDKYNYVVNGGGGNTPPTVDVGSDVILTLPINSLTPHATASDPDGSISAYSWTQLTGPNTATITNGTTADPTISSLVQGVYVFRVTVTDNGGATAFVDLQVTVEAANKSFFQWYKADDTSGTNLVAIPGANEKFYDLPAADSKYYRRGATAISVTGNQKIGIETYSNWIQNT